MWSNGLLGRFHRGHTWHGDGMGAFWGLVYRIMPSTPPQSSRLWAPSLWPAGSAAGDISGGLQQGHGHPMNLIRWSNSRVGDSSKSSHCLNWHSSNHWRSYPSVQVLSWYRSCCRQSWWTHLSGSQGVWFVISAPWLIPTVVNFSLCFQIEIGLDKVLHRLQLYACVSLAQSFYLARLIHMQLCWVVGRERLVAIESIWFASLEST